MPLILSMHPTGPQPETHRRCRCDSLLFHGDVYPHSLEPHLISYASRRLAETVCSELIGTPARVATLLPSGRPIVLPYDRSEACMVSLSHTPSLLTAVACRGAVGIGIDLVPIETSSRSLEWCLGQGDDDFYLADDSASTLRLWAAKEAAYKASCLDVGFQPLRVRITCGIELRFEWTIPGDFSSCSGIGFWAEVAGHILAVAIQPNADCPFDHFSSFSLTS